jgi:hypothetical protein
LSDVQRAVATNRPLIDSSGHRPGFAFVNDAAARARMYALKDVEYENAWRGPNATCFKINPRLEFFINAGGIKEGADRI